MLWKDIMPVHVEQLIESDWGTKPENRPKLRPQKSQFGSQITIEGAEGVPIPAQSPDFDR